MSNPVGRPPKFSDSRELENKFTEWKKTLEFGGSSYGEIPDIESFCNYIESYRDLFSEYEKKEEFSDTIKRIKNWIYYKKKQLAMANKMNATVFIFDAKNNFGYVDKQEIDQNISGELKTGQVDPKLAEDFANYLKHKS